MQTIATMIATRIRPPTPAPVAMGTIDCASVTDADAASVELPVVGDFVVMEVVELVVITENIQMVIR